MNPSRLISIFLTSILLPLTHASDPCEEPCVDNNHLKEECRGGKLNIIEFFRDFKINL